MLRPLPASPEVKRFLRALPSEERSVIESLRRLVRAAAPDTRETVAWKALSYHLPRLGGRVAGAVCQIGVMNGQVQVGFIHGVLLPDPDRLLLGEGKSKRHVNVTGRRAVPRRALRALVEAAVKTRPTGDAPPSAGSRPPAQPSGTSRPGA